MRFTNCQTLYKRAIHQSTERVRLLIIYCDEAHGAHAARNLSYAYVRSARSHALFSHIFVTIRVQKVHVQSSDMCAANTPRQDGHATPSFPTAYASGTQALIFAACSGAFESSVFVQKGVQTLLGPAPRSACRWRGSGARRARGGHRNPGRPERAPRGQLKR